MIVVRALTKSYGRAQILRGVSFEARPGEITLLVGPNGAGKSTTLRVLAGTSSFDGGEALLAGKSLAKDRLAAQRQLAYLPQTPNFHARFSCRQIVDYYAELRGLPRSAGTAALAGVGLSDVAAHATRTLSGGMKQRLGLALLLLPDAPILLLDEPGISLDPDWRRRLQELLHREACAGKTILVTTHLLAEWNRVAHRCLLCREGVIDRELDPANLPADFDELGKPSMEGRSGGATTATTKLRVRSSMHDDAPASR